MTGTTLRRMSVASRLDRYAGRPLLVAIAAMNVITGLVAAWILVPLSFGADVDFLRRGAQGLLDGTAVPDFVFTPLCAVVAVPLARMSADQASVVMSLLAIVILLVGVALETRNHALIDRLLVAIAVLGFLPVVNEVILGQVTLLTAATAYPFRDRDGLVRGIAFGVALALVPKPMLIPLLIWMAVRRPRALLAAVGTAALLTLVGLLVVGTGPYSDWLAALRGAGEVTRHGSFSIWVGGLTPIAFVAAGAVVAGFAIAMRRPDRGFVGALVAGLLLAPYSLLYAMSILVVGVRPALGFAPRTTRILALVANLALIVAPMAFLAAGLAATAWRPTRVAPIAGR